MHPILLSFSSFPFNSILAVPNQHSLSSYSEYSFCKRKNVLHISHNEANLDNLPQNVSEVTWPLGLVVNHVVSMLTRVFVGLY